MTATAPAAPGGKPNPTTVPASTDRLERIPLDQLHESTHNPRKFYDPQALAELADSLLHSGQLTPVLVRPRKGGGFELAAGHRRLRAAKLALQQHAEGAAFRGLDRLLAIVRELEDKAFIEALNIENLQRRDLQPLEEAQGFADLIKHAGYEVKKIAERVGMSKEYVYARLQLLDLVPEAKELLAQGRITAGHAILIARESREDQKRIIGTKGSSWWQGPTGGLFEREEVDRQLALGDPRKPRSVRELASWIDDHVRKTPDRIDPFLFPESAQVLTKAQEVEEKVVHITRDFQVHYDARDNKLRTIGGKSWKRADGRAKSRTCEHSVIGVVVAGPGRGEAFRVCIRKDKCTVHWPEQARAAAKRKKKEKTKPAASPEAQERETKRQAAEEAKIAELERQAQKEERRWAKARPAIVEAIAKKVRTAPAGAAGVLGKIVMDDGGHVDSRARKLVPPGKDGNDLIRHLAFARIYQDAQYNGAEFLKETATDVGVDWKAILDEVAPPPVKKPQASSKAKPKKAKKGKKR